MAEREVAYYKYDPTTRTTKPIYAGRSVREDGRLQQSVPAGPVRPPLAAQPYLPRSFQEYFFTGPEDLRDPKNPEKPLVKPLSDYYATLNTPEATDFRKRAWRAFVEEPSIRMDDGKAVSPSNWLMGEMANPYSDMYVSGGDETAALGRVHQVYEHLAGKARGDESIEQAARMVLGKLREQAPGGKAEAFPGQTAEQAQARSKPLQESRYQTSAGMDQNLKALRAMNILSTFEESPEYRPSWSGIDANMLSLPAMVNVGAAPAGLLHYEDPIGAMRALNRPGDPGHDIRHLAYLRNLHSIGNPAEARMKEALYWDQLAEQGAKEGTYRDSLFGGYYPQYSWMTSAGMQNQSEMDRANYLSRFEKGKDLLLSGMPPEQWERLTHLANSLHREVPVVAPGTTPEDAEAMRKALMEVFAEQEQRFIDEYPLYQRKWNDTIGQLPGMKVEQYSYPSPALNNVAMAPKYYLDAPTIATLGYSLPVAAATGSLRALGTGLATDFMRDQVTTEQPFAAAMYTAHPPYNTDFSKLFQPMDGGTGNVRNEDGTLADPNASNYRENWDAFQSRRAKRIEELLNYQKKYYPMQQPSPVQWPSRHEPKF